jgi:RNA polymerase sigma-70 factor (ECF subfamily)
MPIPSKDPDASKHDDFLRLFVKNEQALRSYARVMLPNGEAVDEVMQEACVIMWRKLDQLKSMDEFQPWAKVIVRYEALKYRRDLARDRLVLREDLVELIMDENASVDESVNHVGKALQHCLSKLGVEQRQLVLLPYDGRGAIDKLAKLRGRSANSLYKKIGRLREKLQACIERQLAKACIHLRKT